MSVKSAQLVKVLFVTSRADTGAATNADSLPTGTLYLNGAANAASVTITNIDTGRYLASVTLPTLAVADIVELSIAATVNSVAGKGVIWRDTADVAINASGQVTVGTNADKTGYSLTVTPAIAGDAMTLTAAYNFARGNVAMTEAYATDGAAATPVEMMHMIWGTIAQFFISGSTLTVKKLDGTTTAMTFALDSATTPTSRTRSA